MLSCPLTELRNSPQLETVLAAYLQAEESGEMPDRQAFLARYPDLADDLQAFFDSRDEVPRLWPAVRPQLQTPCRFGDYELLEEIAHGGMGIVYKARQLRPNRIVALKLILSGQLARRSGVERFHAEAEAAASLDHPNIVPIYEVGQHAGQHYFTMKLIPGTLARSASEGVLGAREGEAPAEPTSASTLHSALRDPQSAARLLSTISRAIHYAHQRGILHRDLKPSNILLGADGQPFVTDFGLAKRFETDDSLTCSGAIVGTPLYMAPEQAAGHKNLTTAADIYSLGAIFYWLLTGQPAIQADSTLELLKQLPLQEPASPRSLNPAIDRDLETICLKCLEKSPLRRYDSAAELADDLDRWLAGEPIQARPATTIERTLRRCRRHPLVTALSSALLLVATLGLFGILTQWQAALANAVQAQENAQQANTQRDEVEKQRDEVKSLAAQLQRTLYASNMNLAQHAWDSGNIGRVNDLLQQHRPKPGEADLRGFEWHYLHRLCHAELLTLKGYSVAFSPDGKRLASFDGNIVKVYDAQTGRELLACKGHTDGVENLTFSPDGKRIASCGGNKWDRTKQAYRGGKPNGELKVWDAQTGQELLDCEGHTNWIMWVTFSADGKRLATASLDNTVKVWDAQTGQELHTFKSRTVDVNSVAFSPDGKRLANVSDNEKVTVRDSQTGQELLTLKGDGGVAFSPDGTRLAIGATLWDVQTGQELLTLEGNIEITAFSPDGKRLAGMGGNKTVKVWDAQTGQELFTFKGHSGGVNCVLFSPDGTRLASSSSDDTVKIWDAITSPEARTTRGFGDNVVNLAFSADGKRLATGSDTWVTARKSTVPVVVKVWDALSGEELLTLNGPARIPVFSPDGKRLAGAGGGVKVWDAQTGQELLTLAGHDGVNGVAYSSDGKRLASAGREGTVKVWDAESGQELITVKGHTDMVWSVAYSPDGKRLASTSADAIVKVWDAQNGHELLSLKGSAGHACNVAFSPDGKRLASSFNPHREGAGEINIWNAQTGEVLLSLKGHTASVGSVAFSPDGKRVVSGSGGPGGRGRGEVKVWDAHTGQELLTFEGGTFGHVVAFTPDGHRLASNAGGAVKIYDATPLSK